MSALIQTIANLFNTCCHHQKQDYVTQEKYNKDNKDNYLTAEFKDEI